MVHRFKPRPCLSSLLDIKINLISCKRWDNGLMGLIPAIVRNSLFINIENWGPEKSQVNWGEYLFKYMKEANRLHLIGIQQFFAYFGWR